MKGPGFKGDPAVAFVHPNDAISGAPVVEVRRRDVASLIVILVRVSNGENAEVMGKLRGQV